jgi:hypothetical protein
LSKTKKKKENPPPTTSTGGRCRPSNSSRKTKHRTRNRNRGTGSVVLPSALKKTTRTKENVEVALLLDALSTRHGGNICKETILDKSGPGRPKTFESQKELKDTVITYYKYKGVAMEDIAGTYGYPMPSLFFRMYSFTVNEYIWSWGVSSVRNMYQMFGGTYRRVSNVW